MAFPEILGYMEDLWLFPEQCMRLCNKQFNEELNSAYIYDSMTAYLMGGNLAGFSSWMNMQASEERMACGKDKELSQ